MGVNLKSIVNGKEISIKELSGRIVAIDAFNWIYQFLTTIRLADGSPLMDRAGNVTSHINGLFYRSIMLLSNNVIPWFIFDGKAPKFKKATLLRREETKRKALETAEKAETAEKRLSYIRRSVKIDEYVIESSKELLSLMGIPCLQAPAEGEAEASFLNSRKVAHYVASQDYDTLLFGAEKVVRNLNITERRKMLNRGVAVQVKPELIDASDVFRSNGLSREKLVLVAMLIGTDYNTGVRGIGPKKALDLVKKESREKILSSYDFGTEYSAEEIYDYFMHPNVIEVDEKPALGAMEKERLIDFMSKEHSFDKDRVVNSISKLSERRESSLMGF
ncbi:MAG: flap endonuclease-1 [Candidatus Parvarchaeota archaeon]